MLSITFKTNALSFFFLSVNEDTSPFPRPSPLSPPVALFIFFLSPSTCLVQAAPPHHHHHHPLPPYTSHGCLISLPLSSSLPTTPPHYLTLSHSITFSLDYPISPSLPASPTRYSSLVLLQSPAQLSDPLPLPSLAP